jgi:hypothetical protein
MRTTFLSVNLKGRDHAKELEVDANLPQYYNGYVDWIYPT